MFVELWQDEWRKIAQSRIKVKEQGGFIGECLRSGSVEAESEMEILIFSEHALRRMGEKEAE